MRWTTAIQSQPGGPAQLPGFLPIPPHRPVILTTEDGADGNGQDIQQLIFMAGPSRGSTTSLKAAAIVPGRDTDREQT
ncbi:MAG: hypothetical protein M9909_06290 [Thermomicrobiales bacterium]|nr:hypothetical protein [Thermomicrobiales bacterium]